MDGSGQGFSLDSRNAGSLKTSKQSHRIAKSPSASSSSSSSSSMNEWPKVHRPPLIRVIHIFNPTVIKTDAANFRSLVQKLTGKNCKSRRSSTSSQTNKKSTKSDKRSARPTSSPSVFEPEFPLNFLNECQRSSDMLGGVSFKDHFFSVPLFESTDSDSKPQFFDLNHDSSLSAADALKMHIPERLGIFSEVDIDSGLESPEPLPDCTLLTSLNGAIDQGMRSPIHRLASFYSSFETL